MSTATRSLSSSHRIAARPAARAVLLLGALLAGVSPLRAQSATQAPLSCELCEDCERCPACEGCEDLASAATAVDARAEASASTTPVANSAAESALNADAGAEPGAGEPGGDAGPRLLSLEGFPYGAVGGLVASAIAGCLVWTPMVLPVGLLAVGMTAGPAATTWTGLAFLAGLLVVPVSSLATLIVVALSPIAVAAGATLDAGFAGRPRWPGIVGASAGWLVLGAGAIAGVAAVGVMGLGGGLAPLLGPAGLVVPGAVLAGGGIAALSVLLAGPAALAGSIAADRWLGGEREVE